MTKTQLIKQYCKQLKLSGLADHLEEAIAEAESNRISYLHLVKNLLDREVRHREQKALQRRTTLARLPVSYNLDHMITPPPGPSTNSSSAGCGSCGGWNRILT